jgi:hypothetical protein
VKNRGDYESGCGKTLGAIPKPRKVKNLAKKMVMVY